MNKNNHSTDRVFATNFRLSVHPAVTLIIQPRTPNLLLLLSFAELELAGITLHLQFQ